MPKVKVVAPPVLDYSEHQESQPLDTLAQITILADKQNLLEADVLQLEEDLDKKKKELENVKVGELPDLMKSVGLEEFKTTSGVSILITDGLHCGIPKTRNGEAIDWLDAHGLARMVKREFVINFNKEDTKWANTFKGQLARRKKPLNYKEDHSVHPQTLKSQIRAILEEGKLNIPFDLFGIYHRPESKIVQDKKSKSKKKKELD